ncbi:hypothetical protein PF008_g21691 [Phytophthora fragariae]|uniref:Reverse transcriptase domain-containing protein n=1 Tax=Phytophthora fragariae TaxID=53985 RepID=A0A6G0QW09_9STRA|nr:hypothetical protein PF008_g21691 [Phytophthora fragariae]
MTAESHRYLEWQNLALQATTDAKVSEKYRRPEQPDLPAVGWPIYPTPRAILRKSGQGDDPTSGERRVVSPVQVAVEGQDPEAGLGDPAPTPQSDDPKLASSSDPDESVEEKTAEDLSCQGTSEGTGTTLEDWKEVEKTAPKETPSDPTREKAATEASVPMEDEQVCYHEGGDLRAEEVEMEMAVLPEVMQSSEDVTLEDIQVGDPAVNTTEEIDRLHDFNWRLRHLLIGKGNALPAAARGIVCDIDVGGAKPIAQRVRKVAPQFREKLSDLIKGLLGARITKMSTSPWASPIVVIIKKNGIDIRLCIDYRLVNSLTRLMIYPMPLINDLLEGLDKVLWYCSLDMVSGFWVVTMTDRARAISAFITPFGLYEWNGIPFGLKNAPPQIYQRMLDNAVRLHADPKTGGRSSVETAGSRDEPRPVTYRAQG